MEHKYVIFPKDEDKDKDKGWRSIHIYVNDKEDPHTRIKLFFDRKNQRSLRVKLKFLGARNVGNRADELGKFWNTVIDPLLNGENTFKDNNGEDFIAPFNPEFTVFHFSAVNRYIREIALLVSTLGPVAPLRFSVLPRMLDPAKRLDLNADLEQRIQQLAFIKHMQADHCAKLLRNAASQSLKISGNFNDDDIKEVDPVVAKLIYLSATGQRFQGSVDQHHIQDMRENLCWNTARAVAHDTDRADRTMNMRFDVLQDYSGAENKIETLQTLLGQGIRTKPKKKRKRRRKRRRGSGSESSSSSESSGSSSDDDSSSNSKSSRSSSSSSSVSSGSGKGRGSGSSSSGSDGSSNDDDSESGRDRGRGNKGSSSSSSNASSDDSSNSSDSDDSAEEAKATAAAKRKAPKAAFIAAKPSKDENDDDDDDDGDDDVNDNLKKKATEAATKQKAAAEAARKAAAEAARKAAAEAAKKAAEKAKRAAAKKDAAARKAAEKAKRAAATAAKKKGQQTRRAMNAYCTKAKKSFKYLGLINSGNTCFANSVIQAMLRVPAVQHRFVEAHKACAKDTELSVLCTLADFAQRATAPAPRGNQNIPGDIGGVTYDEIDNYTGDDIKQGRQNDAIDYFRFLLEELDKNSGVKGLPMFIPEFEGHLADSTKCTKCKTQSNKRNAFLTLPVSIVSCGDVVACVQKSLIAVERLTQGNFARCQVVQANNKECGQLIDQRTHTVTIWPNTLVIQLQVGQGNRKNFSRIRIPEKMDTRQLYGDGQTRPRAAQHVNHRKYMLQSVVIHNGNTLRKGHYYTFAKNAGGRWFLYNDENVCPLSDTGNGEKQIKCILDGSGLTRSETPYMLLYVAHDGVSKVVPTDGPPDVNTDLEVVVLPNQPARAPAAPSSGSGAGFGSLRRSTRSGRNRRR